MCNEINLPNLSISTACLRVEADHHESIHQQHGENRRCPLEVSIAHAAFKVRNVRDVHGLALVKVRSKVSQSVAHRREPFPPTCARHLDIDVLCERNNAARALFQRQVAGLVHRRAGVEKMERRLLDGLAVVPQLELNIEQERGFHLVVWRALRRVERFFKLQKAFL
ncbi:predicted protein [Clavispora lusitaniae ATCC 42720]|uniref:Uncharacterized protein n=1 Tax=Clavispora lusitaniae (strain ATCC 42720) TaxID=306902 RepID=C4Y1S2_CLAL4|nr:uncharacterized protein CLUG_02154 [Clavispora lusitaniae ATCC 42720]EEQ38031.1 predicted protein [Clavispora lusitaniae ATCC 42720]